MDTPVPVGGRPMLVVQKSDLTVTARSLCMIIAASGRILGRGVPVRVDPGTGGSLPRVARLSVEGVILLAHELASVVMMKDDNALPVTLPDRVAKLYLAIGDWGLRPLKGITGAPLLAADGGIRSVNGYDPQSGLWCANVPEMSVPPHPSCADAEAALLDIRRAFQTFPFADAPLLQMGPRQLVDISKPAGADETAFLVGLLSAACRSSLPLVPGLLIKAPNFSGAGTGKGLLARSICAIAFGSPPYAMTSSGKADELEKRIVAALIEARPVLFLDNVNRGLPRSDILASILTEQHVSVRPLGVSQSLSLTPNTLVLVTGNGISLTEDLARRFLVCELDAKMEDPEQRPFEPGFLDAITARRAELLSALLTIWRWARQNEASLTRGRPLGSFELWRGWVRDPLLTLGCADPVARIGANKANDPHRLRIIAIFATWWSAHGATPVSASQLAEPVCEVIDELGKGRQFVASQLAGMEGTRAAGFVLVRQRMGKWSADIYALRKVEDEPRPTTDPPPNPMTPMTPMPQGG